MARQTEKKLECVLPKADGDLFEAMCKRCGFTPQDYFAFCVDKAITAPADTRLGAYIDAILSDGPAIVLDLTQAEGFTLEQLEHAADQCGQSVNEWVLEAIRDRI